MITTYSGINIQEGFVASQCLDNFDWLESQETNSALQSVPLIQEQAPWELFAFPSHNIMHRLLMLFSGKRNNLPENILLKNDGQNDPAATQRVRGFVESVLHEAVVTETYGENNELIREIERIAIISDNPLVHGMAKIPDDLFDDNLEKREEELAFYIRKTFGAEGLRHFLGLIIGLDENDRKGEYQFNINEHLERLGYQRSKNGSFDPAIKWKAFRIIQVLSSLYFTISTPSNNKQKVTCIKLFNLDRYELERECRPESLIQMSFVLRANDDWYGQAFRQIDTRSQQYTQLLKKVATENHQDHPLAIYLAVRFAMHWRIRQFKPFPLKVQTVMKWCCLDHTKANRSRMRDLRKMETELNYMVQANYLGGWSSTRSKEPRDPFVNVLQFDPPGWLGKNMHTKVRITRKAQPTVTVEGLRWIQRQASLSQKALAERLGISRQHISNIMKGRNRISPKLSQKITEIFGYLFLEVSSKSCPT